jgi:hypothetical protein
MHRFSFPASLLLPLLLGSLYLFPDQTQAQEGETFNHFLSGYLLEMYEDSRPANRYLVMTLSGRQKGGAGNEVECILANLTANALDKAYRCELRRYSTGAGTITNPVIQETGIAFDLHVGGSDADKKLRVTCTLEEATGKYAVNASGTWSDQTHTEFTRVKWKQLESVELKHDKLLPALY